MRLTFRVYSILTFTGRAFCEFARKKKLAAIAVGLLALGIRASLIPFIGVPEPLYHDEFSYLLAADTFAHGKLANPPHPMWIYFETFHVIQQPTYSSIYPPAQGLVLAAGKLLGHPWIGEWIVTGLMCSTLCWMLQGWLPPKWAFYGAILALLRIGILRYWMNGYWSSSIVALGGALVLGALPRIKKKRRIVDAVIMAVGLGILANSRPYEGLVLAVSVGVSLFLWIFGIRTTSWRVALTRVILPLAGVLTVTAIGTGYYYYRVTGSPVRLTYQLDSQISNPVPYFLWQTPRSEPTYHHQILQKFYEQDLAQFWNHRTIVGFFHYSAERARNLWSFYLGEILTVPLLMLPWAFSDRRLRFPLIACGLFIFAIMAETWGLPHYAAPITCLIFLIVTQCSRHLALWTWRNQPLGRLVVLMVPLFLFGTLSLRFIDAIAHPSSGKTWQRGNLERAAIVHNLETLPGKHLILVSYAPEHDPKLEWVYNRADIDNSKIVWAHDMGNSDNQPLLHYFKNRQVWTIFINDTSPPRVARYSGPTAN